MQIPLYIKHCGPPYERTPLCMDFGIIRWNQFVPKILTHASLFNYCLLTTSLIIFAFYLYKLVLHIHYCTTDLTSLYTLSLSLSLYIYIYIYIHKHTHVYIYIYIYTHSGV